MRRSSQLLTFIAHASLTLKCSPHCLTPKSVFQDGPLKTITPTSMNRMPQSPRADYARTPTEAGVKAFINPEQLMLACEE